MKKEGERKTGECAYCGETKEMTVDHVIPRCLFIPPFPQNMIKVPACEPCNNAKSLNDGYLRDLLTLDVIGCNSPIAQILFDNKVMSAFKQKKSEIGWTMLTESSIKPFYTKGGIYLGDYRRFPIDRDRVTGLFSTMVRGLYYEARQIRIPETYDFDVRRIYPWECQTFWNDHLHRLPWNGPRILGDVFRGAFAPVAEDPCTTMWLLAFYDRVCFAVTAANPELMQLK